MKRELQFGSKKIVYTLKYEQRKSMNIQVHPDESVHVRVPAEAKEEEIERKLKTKALWILKQMEYFASFNPRTPKRRYISGETHLYLGRQYQLKVVPADTNCVKAYRGQLWVYTTNTSPSSVEQQLNTWYTERARMAIYEIARSIAPQFQKFNISEPLITVRKMQKRWGSCTQQGKISLNTELIKAPKSCIEYVLVHELCHLVYFHHKTSFYNLLTQKMPDWQKRKARLEYLLA